MVLLRKILRSVLNESFRTKCIRTSAPCRSGLSTQTQNLETTKSNTDYDIIICGGGMVGASMAAALGHSHILADRKVLLLEGGNEKPLLTTTSEVPSSRTCALSLATQKLLNGINAWSTLEALRLQEVKRMQVWDSASDSMITFTPQESDENLAFIAENDLILSAIMEQVEHLQDRVHVRYGARVSQYELPLSGESRMAQVQLSSGEVYESKLLIGADGLKSLLRQTCDIHTINKDYKQMAVVTTLHVTEDVGNNVAWQRFLKTGPIAMLPVSPRHSCLIWSTTPDNAKRLLQLPHDSFVDAVNDAFWSDEGKNAAADYVSQTFDGLLTAVGLEGSSSQQLPPTVIGAELSTRGAFPLGLCHASQYVQSRVVLIGDAAHRVHPLAGQGVNLGFGDVTCLVKQLEKATLDGADIGSLDYLLEYETERQRQVVPVMAGIDGINALYSTAFTPFVLMRTIGLQAINAMPQAKSIFMEKAAV